MAGMSLQLAEQLNGLLTGEVFPDQAVKAEHLEKALRLV